MNVKKLVCHTITYVMVRSAGMDQGNGLLVVKIRSIILGESRKKKR